MLKILGRNNSSNVQKVLWALGELGLEYTRDDIGGPFGGNRETNYLIMNPNGLVPTLIDGDTVLWESNVIVRYLARKYAPNSLLPDSLTDLARAEQWMDWQQTVVAPAHFPVFWGLIRTAPEDRDLDAINNGRDRFEQVMTILDHHLSDSAFVGGENLSMADIPVGIMVYRWFTLDIERMELPSLHRWYQRLADRPAYKNNVMIGLT
ncbi:MAG: glutathione S-transferase family protein [Pseudomonadota bacterium]|jgi:glutathione S-transferase|nr:glutathione S-transferase family protein [Pseudomonadota bacterium]MEC8888014.1 glutathione S-transferase family protein [Pseudomonadota bacterium]MEC8960883.1 glutathione S-transferase family protein [Pseudomonadota bacterium]MEE3294143.1 glutathione S-transferase family protein [Pseudomonadota bacterium]|tara:strand:- start:1015 stop:1635 length:621 start_codon:yes stop_codon:yes gene_type:complete